MLTRATAAKLVELGTQGVTSGQDLSIITYDDSKAILLGSGLLIRRNYRSWENILEEAKRSLPQPRFKA
jgi:hypothetical protein